ncbi:RNA polymerase sigma factor [Marivita sp.]|uniref:RNA polymerase sigma factor n=1 Tax=Marivita sp. TaxID=2003365 RepID=UPI0025C46AC5|nr:RNA polymerase sigma factor [Marivita sp.]
MAEHSDPRDEVVEHLSAMRAFAMSLTRNSALADDMVQDALVKAWSKIDSYQPGTNMRAWLFTILRNTYYSHHRKARREVADVDGEMAAALSQKPDHDGRLQMRDFNHAFEQLKDEQREALILVGAGGFSYEEAAQTCGVAIGTIKSRVNRARKQLVELLQMSDDEVLEATDVVTTTIVSDNKNVA